MEISSIITVAVIGFVILAIGGGGGYWIWVASRPKKMSWKALVYQVGDGIVENLRHKGRDVIKYKLSDLKPYTRDIVEKIDKKSGATHYWLQKLKKPTPAVTADCVEVWDQNDKVVRILIEGDTCTLLKAGYDRLTGTILFRPMPHDRINMIKTELTERKERIENTRDILAAITPFIVAGIAMLGLVAIAYFNAQAGVKIAESSTESAKIGSDAQISIASMYAKAMGVEIETEEDRKIEKEQPPEIPP